MMMDEARGRAEWGRLSILAATVENSTAFRTGKPASPDKYNPYARIDGRGGNSPEARERDTVRLPFKSLRLLFCKPPPAVPAKKPAKSTSNK